ncbi:hypothetical protein Forpe1208_v015875 [Fusarium oxysporum f. sp. rapae]|uniref:Uncharacterized protein n=1 Tax=Fusarium oxysporum f. sp. rapae TaxID=485398 RepID=A0A8J5TXU1_FUSOX|nr:hypothetical protein Forpe1208_v015875 [Fusarium oxysporum f. sp. rapae]
MSDSFERFELSTTAESIEAAGRNLTGRRPLPRKNDENGTKVGAKGFQYDWRQPHQLLWNQVVKDRADQLKAWIGNPPLKLVKSVVTLEAEYSLRTPVGTMSVVVPIDGQTTEVAILTAGGDVIEGEGWCPNSGYQLREDVAIGAAKHDITFILVQVAKKQAAT